ncbi:MAG: DUF4902 domain-containing protein [Pseudomonadota bacterium]
MFSISTDGYIRLTLAKLRSFKLIHLISGMDEDVPPCSEHGAISTAITGYTEWVSSGTPALTIGWDWQMNVSDGNVCLTRISESRSNILLQDGNLLDLGPTESSALLDHFVDTLDWHDTAADFINARYEK